MPLSDPADVLLAHGRWATGNMLNACAALTPDQFHQRFDMGPGSLHDTMTHVLAATRGWTDMLRGDMQPGKTPRPRLDDGEQRTAEQLIELHTTVADEFEQIVRAHPLDDMASGERGGRAYAFPRGGVLTHVTTHAMHHRAQCINMLRRLGVEQLPPSSVVEWMIMVNTA